MGIIEVDDECTTDVESSHKYKRYEQVYPYGHELVRKRNPQNYS
jgi:hypothetical protein